MSMLRGIASSLIRAARLSGTVAVQTFFSAMKPQEAGIGAESKDSPMTPISPEQQEQMKVALGTTMAELLGLIDRGHWAKVRLAVAQVQQQMAVLDTVAAQMIMLERLEAERNDD
jgi:hypothetical protein